MFFFDKLKFTFSTFYADIQSSNYQKLLSFVLRKGIRKLSLTFNRKIFSNPNAHPREVGFNHGPKQKNNVKAKTVYKNSKVIHMGELIHMGPFF